MRFQDTADSIRRDIAFAWRGLRRQPGFTTAAVLTVGLCVGANTAIFGVVNAVLLQPLPYARADRLVMVWNHWTNWPATWLSQPEAYDYADQRNTFDAFAPYSEGAANLTGGSAEPERVHVGLFTPAFLPTVGVTPVVGRGFTTQEDQPNGPDAVLLDYALWQRRYGGDRGIVGRRIEVNGVASTVVGILPPGFRLPDEFAGEHAALYRPLRLGPKDENQRGGHYLLAVARLAPGVTTEQGTARLSAFIERYKRDHPNRYGPDFGASLVPMRDQIVGAARRVLLLLVAAVGFVLLIGCANVASLLLSRAERRQREIAVRAALGAGRPRLARQFLVESLVLGLLGAALALPLAAWGGAVLTRLGAHELPRADVAGRTINGVALVFTLAAAIVASAVFGLAPAIHALRGDLQSALRAGRNEGGDRRGLRLRQAIVAAQIILAVVSIAGAALMTRSFEALLAVPAGFHPDHALTMRLSLPATRYPGLTPVRRFYADLLERVRALPGVRAAGAINALPLTGTIGDWGVQIAGRPEPTSPKDWIAFDWQVATPGYFEAMGIPIIRGRPFSDADRRDAAPAVIISQTTARQYWPTEDPVGARVRLGGSSDSVWRTVIGVAGDVHHVALDKQVRAEMYLPEAQFPATTPESEAGGLTGMTLVIRTALDPAAMAGAVRRVIRSMDAQLPVAQVRPLDDVVAESVSTPRLATVLLGAFGVLALVLSAVGVYGVMAYSVARRTGEIGIRMALGARGIDVLRLVVRQGMQPALVGLVVGSGAALLCARFMRGLVYGVRTTDGLSLVIAVTVLAGVALAATTLAARRVTRVDPAAALRAE